MKRADEPVERFAVIPKGWIGVVQLGNVHITGKHSWPLYSLGEVAMSGDIISGGLDLRGYITLEQIFYLYVCFCVGDILMFMVRQIQKTPPCVPKKCFT